MKLNNLRPAEGSTHSRRRIGRGPGSGLGGTSTRGHKGAKSRSGYKRKIGFEGGQMPLFRRIPKRGFTDPNSKVITGINVSVLEDRYNAGDEVTLESLLEKGIVRKLNDGVKILGNGELTKKLSVKVNAFSQSAKEKIEACGGTCEVI